MPIIDQHDLAETALPVAELAEYLQLEAGVDEAGLQSAILPRVLRSSALGLEARLGLGFVRRSFTETFAEISSGKVTTSRTPEIEVVKISKIGGDGQRKVLDISPQISATQITVPAHIGSIEVEYIAGFVALPPDLKHAWILQASQHYLDREIGSNADPRIEAMIAPYRRFRMGLGV